MNQDEIGKFILKLRTEKKLSQYQLADMIPITRQAVSKWERGQTIPDSSTLLRLSEIFDVTINELLKGKRLENNTIEELETTALNMVDENNRKAKKIRQIAIRFYSFVGLFLLTFLSYYFINSYNTIKVYTVSGTNNQIDVYNGMFITTKEKSYLKLGKVKRNTKPIKEITLYYIKNKRKTIIGRNKDIDEIILDENGYDEKFKQKDMKYILRDSYLEIVFDDGTKNNIKLKFERDFVNNSLIFKNKDKVINESETLPVSTTDIIDTKLIIEKIKKNGVKDEDTYIYKIEEENKIITFNYYENINLIQLQEEDDIVWDYYLNSDTYTCKGKNQEECKKIIIKNIEKYSVEKGSN